MKIFKYGCLTILIMIAMLALWIHNVFSVPESDKAQAKEDIEYVLKEKLGIDASVEIDSEYNGDGGFPTSGLMYTITFSKNDKNRPLIKYMGHQIKRTADLEDIKDSAYDSIIDNDVFNNSLTNISFYDSYYKSPDFKGKEIDTSDVSVSYTKKVDKYFFQQYNKLLINCHPDDYKISDINKQKENFSITQDLIKKGYLNGTICLPIQTTPNNNKDVTKALSNYIYIEKAPKNLKIIGSNSDGNTIADTKKVDPEVRNKIANTITQKMNELFGVESKVTVGEGYNITDAGGIDNTVDFEIEFPNQSPKYYITRRLLERGTINDSVEVSTTPSNILNYLSQNYFFDDFVDFDDISKAIDSNYIRKYFWKENKTVTLTSISIYNDPASTDTIHFDEYAIKKYRELMQNQQNMSKSQDNSQLEKENFNIIRDLTKKKYIQVAYDLKDTKNNLPDNLRSSITFHKINRKKLKQKYFDKYFDTSKLIKGERATFEGKDGKQQISFDQEYGVTNN